jgi:hypothetical protein
LTEKLSNPIPQPKVPELPTGRPYAIVTFLYRKSPTRSGRRIVRVQSMDEDYLTGYEIKNEDDPETGDFKKFITDKICSSIELLRQDIS